MDIRRLPPIMDSRPPRRDSREDNVSELAFDGSGSSNSASSINTTPIHPHQLRVIVPDDLKRITTAINTLKADIMALEEFAIDVSAVLQLFELCDTSTIILRRDERTIFLQMIAFIEMNFQTLNERFNEEFTAMVNRGETLIPFHYINRDAVMVTLFSSFDAVKQELNSLPNYSS